IPNRTVKQFCADDSAATSVKVGYRQACYIKKPHQPQRAQNRAGRRWGFFPSAFLSALNQKQTWGQTPALAFGFASQM
ncbi:hypothetical protein, partial [Janthinobacterium sp. CG_23.3]|uniref:hypothetical protein n=1 Tax=Janthinobacterium sp. CG_23.3 TaxID=3349634 RepID=UPI0038D46C09